MNPRGRNGLVRAFASSNEKKKVIVCVADGSEEIETSCIYDTLVRGGVDVRLAKVDGQPAGPLACIMSRGMSFNAEVHFEDIKTDDYDMIVLPGGLPGSKAFAASDSLKSTLQKRKEDGKWYAAICAAPAIVLEPNDLLPKTATCFPALHNEIESKIENDPKTSRVVIDREGKVVTSQGPGTSLEFGVELLRVLVGNEKADEVAK
eukprot:CAMPEP_0167751020 /NCGR_PEP_ID=MMETSP0110_2-20121227/6323_1 /TAXON_ID=629695 /ORGANISM="Gymnochlora sp., Strain CCMP2014" /LENGTH=204 /DNA_ID=CAMNT_0007636423 /DNA_START=141 /DNA_END=752 /DNA_ORIENTATION=-